MKPKVEKSLQDSFNFLISPEPIHGIHTSHCNKNLLFHHTHAKLLCAVNQSSIAEVINQRSTVIYLARSSGLEEERLMTKLVLNCK